MKNRNPFTKHAARLALAYHNAVHTSLHEAYRSHYSDAKYNAEKLIRYQMDKIDNGEDFRITSRNTFMFTCAYTYADKKTGEIRLRTVTPRHDYDTLYMDKRTALEILNA